jgi:hypothetical protein
MRRSMRCWLADHREHDRYRTGRLLGRGSHREAGVVVGHEAVAEEPIGGRHGLDPGQARVPNTRSMRPRPCGE